MSLRSLSNKLRQRLSSLPAVASRDQILTLSSWLSYQSSRVIPALAGVLSPSSNGSSVTGCTECNLRLSIVHELLLDRGGGIADDSRAEWGKSLGNAVIVPCLEILLHEAEEDEEENVTEKRRKGVLAMVGMWESIREVLGEEVWEKVQNLVQQNQNTISAETADKDDTKGIAIPEGGTEVDRFLLKITTPLKKSPNSKTDCRGSPSTATVISNSTADDSLKAKETKSSEPSSEPSSELSSEPSSEPSSELLSEPLSELSSKTSSGLSSEPDETKFSEPDEIKLQEPDETKSTKPQAQTQSAPEGEKSIDVEETQPLERKEQGAGTDPAASYAQSNTDAPTTSAHVATSNPALELRPQLESQPKPPQTKERKVVQGNADTSKIGKPVEAVAAVSDINQENHENLLDKKMGKNSDTTIPRKGIVIQKKHEGGMFPAELGKKLVEKQRQKRKRCLPLPTPSSVPHPNYDFEKKDIPFERVNPSTILSTLQSISSLQIIREVQHESTMRLSKIIDTVDINALRKVIESAAADDDSEPDVRDILPLLPDAVLDLRLDDVAETLKQYRNAVKRQRDARAEAVMLIKKSHYKFGSEEAAAAFEKTTMMLEGAKKVLAEIRDAMELEGLDFEIDDTELEASEGGVTDVGGAEETELEAFDWYKPHGAKKAKIE